MEFNSLSIPTRILSEMREHVSENLPNEACGLLGGIKNTVSIHIPVQNILQSTNEFRMSPEEQLGALQLLENSNMDLLAIYHSHPDGPDHPSQMDLELHLYPSAICVILNRKKPEWGIQAFRITKGMYKTISINEID